MCFTDQELGIEREVVCISSRYEDESARCVIIKLVNSPIPDELAPSSAVSAAAGEKEDHLAAFLHWTLMSPESIKQEI